MPDARGQFGSRRRQLVILGVAIVTLYVIVPQFGSFRHSLGLIPSANRSDLLLAVLGTAASYFAAAGTYVILAQHSLHYLRTLLVQIAGMFINRLLPAGIGGMGVNYAYLKRSRHSSAQALSVVAVNNALGIIGNLLLLLGVLALADNKLPPLHDHVSIDTINLLLVVAVGLTVLSIVLYVYFGQRVRRSLQSFLRQLSYYRHHPRNLALALAFSMTLTFSNVASLWLCALAMHAHLSLAAVLVVSSFGVLLGTATPTPGGLGGVEAGLVAGLVVYGVDSATALATVLVYRLISYWLPIAAGGLAFAAAQRRKYL